ncbi:MAG: mevalonate kinase [Saprospiraceae bacterium]|nr:mevalonate kinase [Saprospiraceae bacterium]
MRTYPAKVLLFGEHILLRGAAALAAPLHLYGGQWQFGSDPGQQFRLREWAEYLLQLPCDFRLAAFNDDLDAGLFFQSDIPTGYGLGSSGALCAAAYERYAEQPIARHDASLLPELRNILAAMESFFHGASSGIDPLVSYLNQPLLLRPDGALEAVQVPALPPGMTLFLLDSRRTRSTGPMVQYFRQRCEDPAFETLMRTELLDVSDAAVSAWLDHRMEDFSRHFQCISRFQAQHLAPMIPDEVLQIWQEGNARGAFSLKLCGAGGGGVFLGLAFTPLFEHEGWIGDFPCHVLAV